MAANDYYYASHKGLRLFGDALDNWVPTRRIWNQHAYHVTNVCDGMDDACPADRNRAGMIPADESRNWELSWLNNFRQNVQGQGLFLAPDLVVINLSASCQVDLSIRLSFDLVNQGSRMIPGRVPVSLYVDDGFITTLTTSRPLLPGQLEHMTFSWPVPLGLRDLPFDVTVRADDAGDGGGVFNECEDGGEDNNQAQLYSVVCGVEN